MSLNLNIYQTLAAAIVVYYIGVFLRVKISVLRKYCIPAPVVGGILFAIMNCILYTQGIWKYEQDTIMQNICMMLFFTSVGYTASISLIKRGGVMVLKMAVVTTILIICQNIIGSGLAMAFNLSPLLGLATGSIPMVGGHGTAFHQTMPAKAFMYGLPYELYKEDHIRRYGFHGTSHRYVAGEVAKVMGVPVEKLRIINCHLGNGSSLAAIKYGKCVDTTMGFTPLAGVLMGTRCGDIDPAIVLNVMDNHNLSTKEMDTLMNKKSGVLGISGVSSDFRDLGQAAAEGNERAQLALDMFHYQVRKEIGAFAAAMGGVDVITFTAGVGENGIEDRAAIAEGLEYLGAKLDPQRNNVRGKDALISTDDSTVKMYVIPTNEEIMIARDTKDIVSKQ